MDLVTIIVPVYNIEICSLEKTLSSIAKQSYDNIECIVIDDGSREEIASFCDLYKKNSRFFVTHKINEGVSSARNVGIELSHGVYTLFVDAGDWIETNCVFEAVEAITENDSDLIGWNNFYESNKGTRKRKNISPAIVCYENDKLNDLLYDLISPYFDERIHNISLGPIKGVWGKLYKTSIVKKIKFDKNLKIGEDAIFNIEYIKRIKKAVFLDKYLYHYVLNPDSANHCLRKDICEVYINLMKTYLNLFSRDSSVIYQTLMTRVLLSATVNSLKKYICVKKNDDRYIQVERLRSWLNDPIVRQILDFQVDKFFFTVRERMLLFFLKKRFIKILLAVGRLM